MDERRFREIFARAPVSIWEEDFSAVGEWLASLREAGIVDLEAHFESKPEALRDALSLVRLLEVNEVTLRLWEVGSKQELLDRWTDLFTDETYEVFAGELLAIWEGRNEVTFHCSSKTATGRPIHYDMHWVAPTVDGEMNLRQVIVAIVDVTEHKETEEALRQSMELTRQLSRRLVELQESERRHLARELHDEFGQLLTAARLHLSAAKRRAGVAAASELQNCMGILNRAAEEVRSLALELRPVVLEQFGLEAALRWLGEQHEQRTGTRTLVSGHLSAIPDEVGTPCFRVVQEALTNIARHAAARRVWIDLVQKPNELQIEVGDDGVGFEVHDLLKKPDRVSFGLLGMKDRIEYLRGRLELESSPGLGTRVRISLPMGVQPLESASRPNPTAVSAL